MSNKHDIFDDLIKSQLEGFEANVSMADWDAIEAKLPVASRNKVAAYWWVTGLVLLLVGSLATIFWNNFKESATVPSEVVVVDNTQTIKQESVVKNNNTPTPTEAPIEKTVNEPNQPERINTEITTTTSSEVEIKTSVQSTTGPDKLPTNIVDIKADENRIKGVVDSAFSTEITDKSSTNDVDPVKTVDPITVVLDDTIQTGNTNDPTQPTFIPKWEIGLSATPTWANKIINPNGGNAWRINKDYNNIAKSMESGSISYQFEARINRYVKENVYFNAGINYNQISEKVNYNYIVTDLTHEDVVRKELSYTPLDPRIGSIEVKYSGTNTYHYFEVPVRIGYIQKVPNSNIRFRFETGLRYMVLADMSGKKTDVTQVKDLIELKSSLGDYSRHNMGATANAGIYWAIGENTDFGIIGSTNYALTSIRKRDEGITEKPYNFGLNFSLQRKLQIK